MGIKCAYLLRSLTTFRITEQKWSTAQEVSRYAHISSHYQRSLNNVPADDIFIGVLVTHTQSRFQAIKAVKWRTVWTDSTDCCLSEKMSTIYYFYWIILQLTYLLTYLLTAWSRVLLEKPTGLQLVKKFPEFYRIPRFITVFTSAHHLSLSWATSIQSIYPHPTSWRSILILSTHLRLGLPSGLFPSGFPHQEPIPYNPHPYAPHDQPISFFSILSPAQYWVRSTDH